MCTLGVHVVVWQNPMQYCRAIALQLKINSKRKLFSSLSIPFSICNDMHKDLEVEKNIPMFKNVINSNVIRLKILKLSFFLTLRNSFMKPVFAA